MLNKFFLNSFLLICIFFCSNVSAEWTYEIVDLGLQESDRSEAVAINDRNQIVGLYWVLDKKFYFIMNNVSDIRVIDLPDSAEIVTLNNFEQIAGNYINQEGKQRGFFWSLEKGFVDIGTLGGTSTIVHDMNDLGEIVGTSETTRISLIDGRQEWHAFEWTNGKIQQLEPLSGDLGSIEDSSVATGINNYGQIIGTSVTLVAHKSKLLRAAPKPILWQFGHVEDVFPKSDQRDEYCLTYKITDYGIASYRNNRKEKKHFFTNINNGNSFSFFSAFPMFLSEGVYVFFSGNGGKTFAYSSKFSTNNFDEFVDEIKGYGCADISSLVQYGNHWTSPSFVAFDYNKNGYLVGRAVNIFGETQAVMVTPKERSCR